MSRYVAISPNPVQKLPVATITSPALLALDDMSGSECEAVPVRGKKRRLDHLTWEEKVQRKKLKNRVAAQTSRDRKKAKMEDMEKTIFDLNEKAQMLQNKCNTLEAINESLMTKNQKLDNQVQELEKLVVKLQHQMEKQHLNTMTPNVQSDSTSDDSINSNRSAASIFNPLQKGMDSERMLSNCMNQQNRSCYKDKTATAPILKIIMLCLLYKICSKMSMSTKSEISMLKNSPISCLLESQKTRREILTRAKMFLVNMQSDCLEKWWGPQQNAWNPAALKPIFMIPNKTDQEIFA